MAIDEIVAELRAQLTTLETKFADLDTKAGKSAGEIKALGEIRAELKTEIDALRADISTREAARAASAAAHRTPLTGDADIDGVLE